MPETLAFTRLLNPLFGGAVDLVMQAVGFHPAHPAAPIDDTFAMELLVACGLILFFLIVRLTLSVENPNPAQQIAEMIHEFTGNQGEQVIGHGYERFQAFVTCVGCSSCSITAWPGSGHRYADQRAGGSAGHRGPDVSLLQLSGRSRARAVSAI